MKKKYKKPEIKKTTKRINFKNNRFYHSFNLIELKDEKLLAYSLCSGPCFPKGTKVLIDENSVINIEKIKKGDSVLSYDIKKKKFIKNKVKEIIINKNHLKGLILINQSLKASPNHPIFCVNKDLWLSAKDFNLDDELILYSSSQNISIIKVKSLKKLEIDRVVLFNLTTVKKPHNFFANGILVHNGPQLFT